MDIYQDFFSTLPQKRTLDVATGSGPFIQTLLEYLPGSIEVVGIDASEKAIEAARAANSDKRVRFEVMNAEAIDFSDGTFDLVCISNSIHHIKNKSLVMFEMLRVLKAGGWFLLSEMVRETHNEAQQTHVLLHHWWAKIDTGLGIVHEETYSRQELIGFIQPLRLLNLRCLDEDDLLNDPFEPELLAELDAIIDRYLGRASGLPNEMDLKAEGELLRKRLRQVGYQNAPGFLAAGQKG